MDDVDEPGTDETGTGAAGPRPLAGLRVLDLADGVAELTSRVLGDLGADVVKVEPPAGRASRRAAPLHAGRSLAFAVHNAGKRSIVLDPAEERAAWQRLLSAADVVVESSSPGDPTRIDPSELLALNPRLVVVSLSEFGQSGPYSRWAGTDRVHLALSGMMSRSGPPGSPPLCPPGRLAGESAALQAVWSTLLAHHHSLETGQGAHVDASVLESTAQVLDPGYGMAGSATGGVPAADGPRGRPDVGHYYPVYACADGYVRIAVLAERQWRGMFSWLGEPDELADPRYRSLAARYAAKPLLRRYIGALFADRTKDELVGEGQRHGVPIAALTTPADVLTSPHFTARGTFTDLEVAPGVTGRAPDGLVEVDGGRVGPRGRAPHLGEHDAEVRADPAWNPVPERVGAPEPAPSGPQRPLAGLRVLDLGVIVAGAELGRLLADQGADVVKVENSAHPDGGRQSLTGASMTATFAWGNRNKRGLGLDLATATGKQLFRRLATQADVILSNFRPGTLESLGLGYDVLSQDNPGLVMADSSALGSTGPWSRQMGYGPLVRALVGVSGLWAYPDRLEAPGDASTVYPDHVAARVSAAAVLSRLLERRRTGRGGTVSTAQAEVVLHQFGVEYLRESLEPGSLVSRGNTREDQAPTGVYPCAGDDEWCVVDPRDDDDWQRLCRVLRRPDLAADDDLGTAEGRVARRAELDSVVAAWTAERTPRECMELLQAGGVPAGAVNRVVQLLDDPQLRARRFFTPASHPLLGDQVLPSEQGPATFDRLPQPEQRPAPLPGQDTREVLQDWLGMPAEEIDSLVRDGVLEVHDAAGPLPVGASA